MRNKNRKLIIIGIISIVIFISIGFFVWFKQTRNTSNGNTLQAIIPPSEKNDKQLPDGSASSPPKPNTNTGIISITGVTKDNSNYYFSIGLSGINKGDCILTVTQNSKSASVQGKVELVTSYYSCSNMKLPISSFSPGKANVNVIITVDGKVVQNSSEELNLE